MTRELLWAYCLMYKKNRFSLWWWTTGEDLMSFYSTQHGAGKPSYWCHFVLFSFPLDSKFQSPSPNCTISSCKTASLFSLYAEVFYKWRINDKIPGTLQDLKWEELWFYTGALEEGKGQDLLHMVDLIMLSFLVSRDLALRLLRQLAQVFLRVLLHGILHCLGQC